MRAFPIDYGEGYSSLRRSNIKNKFSLVEDDPHESGLERGIRLAEHYIAIQSNKYYIEAKDATDELYSYVTKADFSGYNQGFKDDISFSAPHPCGLTFEWYIDCGRDSENRNYGKYRGIDEERFLAIMDKLPPKIKKNLMKELDSQVKGVIEELSEARHQVTLIEHDLSLVKKLKGKYVQPVSNRNRKHQKKVQDLQEDPYS